MDTINSRSPALLLDLTRLVWRVWRGRYPTGIDRVCLAYLRRFRGRALAVVQHKGFVLVLSKTGSKRLFDLLLPGRGVSKNAILRVLSSAVLTARRAPPRRGMLYLNVGHTGLDNPVLARWIALNGIKAVHLIHDLIPITNPEFCRAGEAEKHRKRIANALKSATGVISNSRATLDDLTRFASSDSLPLPPALVAWICGSEGKESIRPKSLGKPYFIALGTVEARKNHLLLLLAWRNLVAAMGSDAPTLVIVGQPGWEAEQALSILENPAELSSHVLTLSSCDDDELASWIAGARAVLMPSFAEGFGLPVVEALSLGTPVIASNLPVFREIAGDLPTYLSPNDQSAWEEAIRSFAGESPERERQLKRIREFKAPTWDEHFEAVEAWLGTL